MLQVIILSLPLPTESVEDWLSWYSASENIMFYKIFHEGMTFFKCFILFDYCFDYRNNRHRNWSNLLLASSAVWESIAKFDDQRRSEMAPTNLDILLDIGIYDK